MLETVDNSNELNLLHKVYKSFTNEDLDTQHYQNLISLIDVLPGLQNILNSLPVGIVIIGKSYDVIYNNSELLRILDLQGPIVGKKWQDVFTDEIPLDIKRVAKEASFNYPTYHKIKINKGLQILDYAASFYPINDAVLIQLSPNQNLHEISNDFSLTYIESIVDNNSEFVSEILQSFIQVVSEDLNKIQFCLKNNNDCGKLSIIAQNIASNINLLGKEDLVLRWKNFIHVGLEKMEDKYELLLLIKLTDSLLDNVKKYNQTLIA
jgi:PAS domain-containing protein